MRILIGATNTGHIDDAAQWLPKPVFKTMFSDLEAWASDKEALWGNCYIFIEVSLPEGSRFGGKRGQIDMLILFADRAAHCEIKSSRQISGIAIKNLASSVTQIEGQRKRLKELFRAGGFSSACVDDCFRSCLLLPNLELNDIEKVAGNLSGVQGAPHIWPVGVKPELKGRWHGSREPFYLTEALEERLTGRNLAPYPIPSNGAGLQSFFLQELVQEGASFLPFPNFSMASDYLKGRPSESLVTHDGHFEPGLREQELSTVTEMLKENRIVLLIGPPEVGKSTFARELIAANGGDFKELHLPKCSSAQDVCYAILDSLGDDLSESLGEETLIRHIAVQPYIFWIRGYNQSSYSGLTSVLHKIHAMQAASDQIQSQWIIESTHKIGRLIGYDYTLELLNEEKILRILDKVETGGAFSDPNAVTDRAQGRPGYALRLWQSHDPKEAEVSDEYEWFYGQLPRDEAAMLSLLCLAASKSPLGFTLESLYQWGTTVFTHRLTSEVRKTIEVLLEKLEDRRLADVIRLDHETLDTFLNAVLPDDCSMVVIDNVAFGLMDHALNLIHEEDKIKWSQLLCEGLEQTYLEKETDYSLTHVTLELNYSKVKDLEPFFRSPFRFTYLRRLFQWAEATEWVPANSKQAYIFKALRILSRISKNYDINVADELGIPVADNPVQQFAYALVQTRVLLSQIDASFNLESWRCECEECPDPQLQAEQYIAAAMSLQHSGRPDCYSEAWSILAHLLKKPDLNLTSRCFAVHQALAFLNRSKDRGGVVDNIEAYQLIQALSQELIATGMKLQNIQLVCDGLFYFVRSQELHDGKKDYSEVLRYRAALRFVEQAQGRTIMRMQVLLTMGSIHRHFCREGSLTWIEFRQNLDEGWEFYQRAFKSALAHHHARHMLNAATYMADFCVKALRYADNNEARPVIYMKAVEALSVCQRIEEEINSNKPDMVGDKNQDMLSNIQRDIAILLYLVTVAESNLMPNQMALIKSRFATQIELLVIRLNTSQDSKRWQETQKIAKGFLTALQRSFIYGYEGHPKQHEALMKNLQPELQWLLKASYKLKDKRQPLKAWRDIADKMPSLNFAAYNLANNARAQMLAFFQTKFDKVTAHHVTYEYPVRYNAALPPRATIRVVGYACDEGMEVAVVEVNGSVERRDGGIYHITLSLDPTRRKPEDANTLLLNRWQRVEPFLISVWPAIN